MFALRIPSMKCDTFFQIFGQSLSTTMGEISSITTKEVQWIFKQS